MKKIFLGFILSAALLSACTKEPTACFSVDKGSDVKENEEVQFNAGCSEDALNYNWAYGDGSTGEGVLTKHKYSHEGTYEVTLTALNGGQSNQATARVVVVK